MNLYDFITEEEIFQKYLYPVDYSKKFINPFRSRDKNAGCKFYKTQDRIYFVDFANPVKTHLSCMDIVQAYYNCDYFTAIYNINIDFNLNLFYKFEQGYTYQSIKKPKIVYQSTFKKENHVNIVVSVKEFDQEGLTFWNNFGYTIKDLEKFKIKQFSRVIYNNTLISNNELAFGYYDKEGLFKVYHPHRTVDNYKFISIRRVLEGIDLIDYDKNSLIITKSYKDVCLFYKAGFNSIAPPSETSINYILKDEIIHMFRDVYIYMDPDETGENASNLLLNSITNSKKLDITINTKDISDFVKLNNFEIFKNQLKKYATQDSIFITTFSL
jgi:hypothetical protein